MELYNAPPQPTTKRRRLNDDGDDDDDDASCELLCDETVPPEHEDDEEILSEDDFTQPPGTEENPISLAPGRSLQERGYAPYCPCESSRIEALVYRFWRWAVERNGNAELTYKEWDLAPIEWHEDLERRLVDQFHLEGYRLRVPRSISLDYLVRQAARSTTSGATFAAVFWRTYDEAWTSAVAPAFSRAVQLDDGQVHVENLAVKPVFMPCTEQWLYSILTATDVLGLAPVEWQTRQLLQCDSTEIHGFVLHPNTGGRISIIVSLPPLFQFLGRWYRWNPKNLAVLFCRVTPVAEFRHARIKLEFEHRPLCYDATDMTDNRAVHHGHNKYARHVFHRRAQIAAARAFTRLYWELKRLLQRVRPTDADGTRINLALQLPLDCINVILVFAGCDIDLLAAHCKVFQGVARPLWLGPMDEGLERPPVLESSDEPYRFPISHALRVPMLHVAKSEGRAVEIVDVLPNGNPFVAAANWAL